MRLPSTATSFAGKVLPFEESSGVKVPVRSQYDAARNAMRSRSRSTTRRVATDCTRPADRPRATLRQRTGEIS